MSGKYESAKSRRLQAFVILVMNSVEPQKRLCFPLKRQMEISHAELRAATQGSKHTGGAN